MSEDIPQDEQQGPAVALEQTSAAEVATLGVDSAANTTGQDEATVQVQEGDTQEQIQAPVFSQPAAEPLPLDKVKLILEAAVLAAGQPLPVEKMLTLFTEDEQPGRDGIREAMAVLADDYTERGIELKEVASGYRLQVRQAFEPWVSRLWEERAPRYTRALLETLALIAYRQPITRGEIEDIRGVSVSSNIVKTLLEREWVRIVGHRDVPGRPAMYATTRGFLDYFNLKGLEELPTLSELRDIDSINAELDLGMPSPAPQPDADAVSEEVDATQGSAAVVAIVNAAVTVLGQRAEQAETDTQTETDEHELGTDAETPEEKPADE